MELTREQLLQIMPQAKSRADKYLVFINRYSGEFGITTALRMSHWLAQVAHESAELRYTKEIASGAAYDTGKKATALGNTPEADGDGQKYKGRGLLQLTGKANYEAYKKYCGFDVVAKPELLEQPLGATRSAMWYWWKKGLNAIADKDDINAVTKKINGGYNGLESRKKYLERAKKALGI